MSAWWLDDASVTIEAREQAYRLYRDNDDALGAARMATWLTWDYLAFRGEPAVANGWLQRARRLLDGGRAGGRARLVGDPRGRDGDPAGQRRRRGASAGEQREGDRRGGRCAGCGDLPLALEGLTLASEGEVAEGIRLLDEASAAAVSGEISELWAVGRTCCYLITACERVRDFDRAFQWSERMLEFAKRWRIPHLFAVCRAHYAGVLVSRGTWGAAEVEFDEAMGALSRSRPGLGFEAVVRLAELRRRQGRIDEATRLFREVEYHPSAQLGLAAVALDDGRVRVARDLADRFLRQLDPQARLQRAAGLELLVWALVADGEPERARTALTELQTLAADVGTDPLRAGAPRRRARSPLPRVIRTVHVRASRTRSICTIAAARRSRQRAPGWSWRERWRRSAAPPCRRAGAHGARRPSCDVCRRRGRGCRSAPRRAGTC